MYDNTCPVKLDKLMQDFYVKYAQSMTLVWIRTPHISLICCNSNNN